LVFVEREPLEVLVRTASKTGATSGSLELKLFIPSMRDHRLLVAGIRDKDKVVVNIHPPTSIFLESILIHLLDRLRYAVTDTIRRSDRRRRAYLGRLVARLIATMTGRTERIKAIVNIKRYTYRSSDVGRTLRILSCVLRMQKLTHVLMRRGGARRINPVELNRGCHIRLLWSWNAALV